MSGPDVEGVLGRHRSWSNNRKRATALRWTCSCGAEIDDDPSGVSIGARHRAHVAAAVNAEVREWLESEGAVSLVGGLLACRMSVRAALAALSEQVGQVASVGEGEG